MVMQTGPFSDTGSVSPLLSAVSWAELVVLGPVGTVIGVIAVAGFGAAMLQGRLDIRLAMRVAVGCSILFGAPGIATGLLQLTHQTTRPGFETAEAQDAPLPIILPPAPQQNLDPYAGASVPM